MARKTDIRLRRSNSAGAIPSDSNLSLGELAINTADGALYFKKSDGTVITAHDNTILHIDSDASNIGDADHSPKVGIGTTSPTQPLTVKANNSSGKAISLISRDANDVAGLQFVKTNGNQNAQIDVTGENLRFYTGTTEKLRIDSSGKVGIGTSSPGVQLDIESSGNNSQLELTATDGTDQSFGIFSATGNNSNGAGFYIQDKTANAIRVKIDSSGNVGIGQTDPTAKLDILGSKDSTNVKISAPLNTVGGGSLADFNQIFFDNSHVSGTSGQAYIRHLANSHNDSEGAFAFGTTTTSGTTAEALRIRGDGKVGIGTTTPSEKLQVAGAIALTNSKFAEQSGSYTKLYANNGEVKIFLGGADQNNYYDNNGHVFRARNTAVEQARITSTGIGIGTSSPSEPLDIRGSDPKVKLQDTDGTNQIGNIFQAGSVLALQSRNNTSNGTIKFAGYNGTAVTEYARFTPGGKLGLGTNSPTGVLHINTGSGTNDANTVFLDRAGSTDYSGISFATAGTVDWSIGQNTAGNFEVFEDGQDAKTRFTVQAGGNVGIGTATPSTPLQISNAGAFTPFRVTNTTNSVQLDVEALSDNVTIGVATNHHLNFQTNNATRLTIKNNGNVGIGETSPDAKLDVRISNNTEYSTTEASELNPVATDALYLFNEEASSTNGKVSILMRDTGGGGGAAGRITLVNDRAGDGSFAFLLRDSAHTTSQQEKMRITSDGRVGIGTSSPGARLQVNASTADNSATDFVVRDSGGSSLLSVRNDGRVDIPGSAVLGSTLSVTGTSTFSDKLTISGAVDELLTLSSTDDGAIYMSFERGTDRHAFVGFGSGGDQFMIVNEESGGTMALKTAGTTAITIDASQNVSFAENVSLVDGKALNIGNSNDLKLRHSTNSFIENFTGTLRIINYGDDSDITIETDNGSGGVVEYLRFDGSHTRMTANKNLLFFDNIKADFGTGSDLRIFHDGTDSTISNGNGDLLIENTADDKDIVFRSDDGSGGTADYIRLDGSTTLTQFDKDTKHSDSVKATFGAGSDLQIYHDGSNSYIWENGTGNLILRATDFRLQDSSGNSMAVANSGGGVGLYHNASQKLETTSTGAAVTGNLTISGNLTVNGTSTTLNTATLNVEDKNITLNKGSGDTSGSAAGAGITIQDAVDATTDATILWDQTNSEFDFSHPVNASNIITSAAFSGTTTKTLTLTQSGGGTITAAFTDISGGGSSTSMADADNDTKIQVEESTDEDLIRFDIAGTEKMVLSSTGLGIQTPGAPTFGQLEVYQNGGTAAITVHEDAGTGTARLHLREGTTDTYLQNRSGFGFELRTENNISTSSVAALQIGAAGVAKLGYNVGIGLAASVAPNQRLVVSDNNGATTIAIDNSTTTTGNNARLDFRHNGITGSQIKSENIEDFTTTANRTSDLQFYTRNNGTIGERMRIMAAGNVGIGTTAPAHELVLRKDQAAATEFSIVNLTDDDSASTSLRFRNATSASETGNGAFLQLDKFNVFRIVNQFGNPLIFGTNNAEKARIDSSGNLLVGKTSTTFGTAGVENRSDGRITSTRSGNTNLFLNRLSSDGSIIDFYKDGSQVGTIGTTGGDLFIGGLDSNHAAIRFAAGSKAVLPVNVAGVLSNNTVDLGQSNAQFKDIYLGGEIELFDGSNNYGRILANSEGLVFDTVANRHMIFKKQGTEFMRLSTNGNFGIGSSTPDDKLHVSGGDIGIYGSTSSGAVTHRTLHFYTHEGTASLSGTNKQAIGEIAFSGTDGSLNAAGKYAHIKSYVIDVNNQIQGSANEGGQLEFTILRHDQSTEARVEHTALTIDNHANVGIGTTTPTAKLNVAGTIKSSGTITSTNGTVTNVMSFSDRGIFGTTSNHPVELRTNNTEKVRITAAGNVGIGTTVPDRKLHVKDSNYRVAVFERTGSPNCFITFEDPNTTQDVGIGATTNDLVFRSGNVTHLSLLGSNGHLKFTDFDQHLEFGSTSNRLAYNQWLMSASGGASIKNVAGPLTINPDDFTAFQVNDVEKVRINATGIGIGTNSPDTRLDVTTAGVQGLVINQDTGNASVSARMFFKDQTRTNGMLNVNGVLEFRTDMIIGNTSGTKRLTVSPTQVETTVPLKIEEYQINTTTATTSATTEASIVAISATAFRSIRFTVQITNSTDDTYHTTEILLVHDGTTANMTEFGTIFTGAAAEATFDADISSGNVRLLATPASTDTMTFKVISHSITV